MKTIPILCVLILVTGCLPAISSPSGDMNPDRESFLTAEKAVLALYSAYEKKNIKAIARILGDKGMSLVYSGDPVIDNNEREWFLSLYRERHGLFFETEDHAVLQLGQNEQPYPIPIVKENGMWYFDPSEGHEDLLSRRISKTELSALDNLISFVEAQRTYFSRDQDGDGVFEYARRFLSAPGQRDGLCWKEETGTFNGPLASLAVIVGEEGYKPSKDGKSTLYRGYFYKILEAQGEHAVGGAREYVVEGDMTGGFALAAFPVRYGISGVLTFIVNQDGTVYQKDLGASTAKLRDEMTTFDPDKTWSKGINE